MDVRDSNSFLHLLIWKIDHVVCTVGVLKFGFLDKITVEDIKYLLEVNLMGNVFVSKCSIPYLRETRGSLLLFGSSSYTYGREGYILYSAAKAALVNFVQGLAEELSGLGIRVNILNPERTNTPMRKSVFGNEDPSTLLSPEYVDKVAINAILSDVSECIMDVRKKDEIRENSNNRDVDRNA